MSTRIPRSPGLFFCLVKEGKCPVPTVKPNGGSSFGARQQPKHTSKLVLGCMLSNYTRIKVLKWSSQSTNLNLNKNLRWKLKVNVHAGQPNNLEELQQYAMEDAISPP